MSTIAGFVVMVALIPLNSWLARILGKYPVILVSIS